MDVRQSEMAGNFFQARLLGRISHQPIRSAVDVSKIERRKKKKKKGAEVEWGKSRGGKRKTWQRRRDRYHLFATAAEIHALTEDESQLSRMVPEVGRAVAVGTRSVWYWLEACAGERSRPLMLTVNLTGNDPF